MSGNTYLVVMIGIVLLMTVVSVPALLLKRCPQCGSRNSLDARSCRKCQAPFAEDGENP